MNRPAQLVRAFGHFWWDFLIGDTPEFAVATLIIVGLAYLLVHNHAHLAAAIVLPLLAAGFLLASTLRGRSRPSPAEPAAEVPAPVD